MLIIVNTQEWDIPFESTLEQRIMGGWFPVMILKEKVSAVAAISQIKKNYLRIVTPGGVEVCADTHMQLRMRCGFERALSADAYMAKNSCKGFLNQEGNKRICEKCRAEYVYGYATDRTHKEIAMGAPKEWHRVDDTDRMRTFGRQVNDRRIVKEKNNEEIGQFIAKTNDKAKKFKMNGIGVSTIDDHRSYMKPGCKNLELDGMGLGWYGGMYRWLEFEIVQTRFGQKARLIATHLAGMEEPEIGDDMAQIVNNHIKVSKYNGAGISEWWTIPIEGYDVEIPIRSTKKICGRCGKEISIEGLCSICAPKEDLKIRKEQMKRRFDRGASLAPILQDAAWKRRGKEKDPSDIEDVKIDDNQRESDYDFCCRVFMDSNPDSKDLIKAIHMAHQRGVKVRSYLEE
jgi:hypothetical protein